jgi:hypothetical protein
MLDPVCVVIDHSFHCRVNVVQPLNKVFKRGLLWFVDFIFVIVFCQYSVFDFDIFRSL